MNESGWPGDFLPPGHLDDPGVAPAGEPLVIYLLRYPTDSLAENKLTLVKEASTLV